jgi:FlaA1/EpsC-like NDP-sugar epimerase
MTRAGKAGQSVLCVVARSDRHRPGDAERVLIFGEGWVGSTLSERKRWDLRLPYKRVDFIDDRNLQIQRMRVYGTLGDLEPVAHRLHAQRVVVAVNAADTRLVPQVSDTADHAGLIAMSGSKVEIAFTGRRPGEKVREELMGAGELGQRPFHSLISHVTVPLPAPDELAGEERFDATTGSRRLGAAPRTPSSVIR